ncbi:N-acetylglucosamine-6-phosphate deacetylase [Bacillus mojavensis]|jgi:N-acetylglucosamine-6-phosphate deacetylase|uniref:N-acetylglucosamine-6-phosphate deacetylase n=1 Tax=Bacillus mojavensis TaxID=72360 RepID=A0AAP3CU97_BACMO|nr:MULTISPECIES: N-acetylglucosamine-6-phosphate deacetylase [Bacillus]MCC2930889.1 N-acetylglucosamine-6-phosphate deacetylase [Bacillus sp. LBG-1-113]MCY8106071.1 N-acetylglucosamine-6-phosphate deacetylase [Bacillus mojavensis]MCY8483044.1 N-acetylglucosamine-6-phosphate deacetylase [Bacillus mojavensis]MCY8511084.1 N-acetylglucosamine-6-phosphate deacetylase [Bacillus mojavensis]MCY9090142.1 N-acetylglucosamine-6-phosphate deacetylase [Bacillus mojavensis]
MADSLLLSGISIVTENEVIKNGYVGVKDGKISAVSAERPIEQYAKEIQGPRDAVLLPGMIDIHIHGGYGADTMDASFSALDTMSSRLPEEGTTSFLATTITQEHGQISQALVNARDWKSAEDSSSLGAELIGIHLEGPFVSPKRAGAQPKEWIRPSDLALFKKWQQEAGGLIKIVTLAPEEDQHFELIRYLKDESIIASMGHTDADSALLLEAFEAGASHMTHLYNAMSPFHHREPGVIGTALAHEGYVTELIADGIHSHPLAAKLAFLAKGSSKLILITDSMRAKGLKDGVYEFGGQSVTVKGKTALLPDGTLAGSILKMNEGAQHMRAFTNCSWTDIANITSANAAKQLGIFDRKGSITEGKDADLVIVSSECEVLLTICRGNIAFISKEADHI